jgi:hypothetical protein
MLTHGGERGETLTSFVGLATDYINLVMGIFWLG